MAPKCWNHGAMRHEKKLGTLLTAITIIIQVIGWEFGILSALGTFWNGDNDRRNKLWQ